MNEAKSLVNMSISAIFSTMILSAVLVLMGIGYTMWSYFSRQDAANQRMKDYVNYVAYDDSTIRGQEVVSLIQYAEQEGYFVAIYPNTTGSIMSSLIPSSTAHVYIPNTCPWESIKESRTSIPVPPNNSQLQQVYNKVIADIGTTSRSTSSGNSYCCFQKLVNSDGTLNYEKLVQAFTNNYSTWTHLGNPNGEHTYAAYRSYLVYDSDTSTDVIGFVLLRQNTNVTNFE